MLMVWRRSQLIKERRSHVEMKGDVAITSVTDSHLRVLDRHWHGRQEWLSRIH
jgi:hypothetical protein